MAAHCLGVDPRLGLYPVFIGSARGSFENANQLLKYSIER